MSDFIKFSTIYDKNSRFVKGVIEFDGKKIESGTYYEHLNKFQELTGNLGDDEVLNKNVYAN